MSLVEVNPGKSGAIGRAWVYYGGPEFLLSRRPVLLIEPVVAKGNQFAVVIPGLADIDIVRIVHRTINPPPSR
jgi:hypothetical protein